MKTSSAEKSASNTAGQFVTYSNFSTQEYSATQSNTSYNGAQGTLSHNAFDELKLQQLQYQKVFLKHNQLPHNLPDSKYVRQPQNLANPESREVKLSAVGLPLQDSEYYHEKKEYNTEKRPFPSFRHQTHHLDDEPVLDDGDSSQLDLVEYASKN